MATMTNLAELATLEFWPTRDFHSVGFEILVDQARRQKVVAGLPHGVQACGHRFVSHLTSPIQLRRFRVNGDDLPAELPVPF